MSILRYCNVESQGGREGGRGRGRKRGGEGEGENWIRQQSEFLSLVILSELKMECAGKTGASERRGGSCRPRTNTHTHSHTVTGRQRSKHANYLLRNQPREIGYHSALTMNSQTDMLRDTDRQIEFFG